MSETKEKDHFIQNKRGLRGKVGEKGWMGGKQPKNLCDVCITQRHRPQGAQGLGQRAGDLVQ